MTYEEYDEGAIAFEPSAIPVQLLWNYYSALIATMLNQELVALSPRTESLLARANIAALAHEIDTDPAEIHRYLRRMNVELPPAGRDSAAEGPASQTPK